MWPSRGRRTVARQAKPRLDLPVDVSARADALPDELREVLVLRELNELSYREISEVVCAPMGTVRSRLSRARGRLAVVLHQCVLGLQVGDNAFAGTTRLGHAVPSVA